MDVKEVFKDQIAKINRVLSQSISGIENERLRAAMLHYPSAGGKRLRPITTMLVADAINKSGERSIPFGVALELVHNFTLVHDDVMDNDTVRRGMETVHIKFGLPEAILAGDALFAKAFEIVGNMEIDGERKSRLMTLLAKAVLVLAEGQQMDMDSEKMNAVSSEAYLKMIERKTAVLFSAAAQGGAIIAGAQEPLQETLFEFGRLIGLAFQIRDDILCLKGDPKDTKKPKGSDIRNGKKTLIVIYALEALSGDGRADLKRILGKKDASEREIDEAIAILESSGAIDRAQRVASEMIARAKTLLDDLPNNEYCNLLRELSDYMITRAS
ncbi:MAG: polyprenyl synthetase family protein [Thermoplasmata archaeon]